MKLIGSNGKYFRAVATPNRKKPKEEEELAVIKKKQIQCTSKRN